MPSKQIVDNGTQAVNGADVALVYKTDVIVPPPAANAYLLAVMLRGIGKPEAPQFRFTTPQARDDFYTKIVAAMAV